MKPSERVQALQQLFERRPQEAADERWVAQVAELLRPTSAAVEGVDGSLVESQALATLNTIRGILALTERPRVIEVWVHADEVLAEIGHFENIRRLTLVEKRAQGLE